MRWLTAIAALGLLAGALALGLPVLPRLLSSSGTPTDPQSTEEPLDVVLVADFSGNDRLIGADLERGFEDALQARGGSKVLRIVRRDDQGKPQATLALAEGAAAGFRTLTIVGPGQSRGYDEFAVQAEEGGVPVLVPVAPPGPAGPGKWVYTLQPSQELQSELAARLVQKIRPARRAVFVTLPDTGSGYWKGLQRALAGSSMPEPEIRTVPADAQAATLASLGKELAQVDLVFVDLPSTLAVPLVVGLRDAGHKGRIVGFGEMALTGFAKRFAELPKERLSAGYYTNGVLAVTAFSPDEVDERSRGLVDAYHGKHGADPSWAYAYGYDVGILLMDFVALRTGQEAAGAKIDPQQWRDALREYLDALRIAARPTSAFTGPITFDDTRQRDTQPSLLTYLYGRPVPYSRQFSHLPARLEPRSQEGVPEIAVGDRYYDLVPIVFSGIRFHGITDLDIDEGNYEADFELWFRSPLRIEPDDIYFPNAVDGTIKATTVESLQEAEGQYQRIRFQGKFRFSATPNDLLLERITLPLAWRHRKLEATSLRFVIDSASFNSVAINSSIHEQILRDKAMAATVGYAPVGSVLGVESRAVRALGDPRAHGGQLIYSEVGMKLVVESVSSTLGPALARRVPAGRDLRRTASGRRDHPALAPYRTGLAPGGDLGLLRIPALCRSRSFRQLGAGVSALEVGGLDPLRVERLLLRGRRRIDQHLHLEPAAAQPRGAGRPGHGPASDLLDGVFGRVCRLLHQRPGTRRAADSCHLVGSSDGDRTGASRADS
jgi:ABC-type branched-subunit amino acid transport system substrate-binding protein